MARGPAHSHAPGLSQGRMVQIEQDILGKNDEYAASNRQRLEQAGILALNLVSSPGAGKTTLLSRTIRDIADRVDVAVIEGDQQTSNDADRIRDARREGAADQYGQRLPSRRPHGRSPRSTLLRPRTTASYSSRMSAISFARPRSTWERAQQGSDPVGDPRARTSR